MRIFLVAVSFVVITIPLTGFLTLAGSSADSGPAYIGNQSLSATASPREQAQNRATEGQQDTIRLSSRLVMVPVSATDASGNPVKDLRAGEIVIEEDGRPQKVVALGEPGKTPVEIALLFDVSGSTQRQFDFERQAAVQFVKEELRPGDAISLFSIGKTPKMVEPRTTSVDEAVRSLMSIEPLNEPTAFLDCVVDAARYLDKTADSASRHVLVVISDGEENYSARSTAADALRELQESDCLFYSINPGGASTSLNKTSREGQKLMEDMASQTGGKAFNPSRAEDLDAVFRQIADELQAQYLFGYYASDDSGAPGFRKITVLAPNRPDLRIRARQGYYVGKTP